MPIVDLAPPDILAVTDTPKGFAVTPGAVDIDHGSDAPTEKPAWDTVITAAGALGTLFGPAPAWGTLYQGATSDISTAAFRQDNTIGAFLSAEDRSMPTYKEPGFNTWESIKGTKYEPYWSQFVEVRNTKAFEAKKRQIDMEEADRKVLHDAPWYQSVPAQIIAGGADLPTLIPGGAFVRGAKGGFSIAKSAASVGGAAGVSSLLQETALQSIEATRPLSESAVNVGASVFLGGLLGAAGAKVLSQAEWGAATRALEHDLANGPRPAQADPVAVAKFAEAVPPEPREASPSTFETTVTVNGETRTVSGSYDPADIAKTAVAADVPVAAAPRKGPAARDPATYSLLEFLASKGGLKPSPDLQSILDGNPFIPGFGRLIRKDGLALDKAREAAVEAKYIVEAAELDAAASGRMQTRPSESTITDLLNLIDNEARGTRQYVVGVEAPKSKAAVAAAREREMAEFEREIDGLLSDTGGARAPDDDKIIKRAHEIYMREGEPDILVAYERAIMEDGLRLSEGKQSRVRDEIGSIPGWDVPHDARAASPGGGSPAAGGSRGEPGGPGAGGQAGPTSREPGGPDRAPQTGLAGGKPPTSAGAAAAGPSDIASNTIAGRAAAAVAAATARLNPALRLLQSPSAAVRDIATKLFENSVYLKKNLEGIASQPAAETLMKEWNAGLASAVRGTEAGFRDHVKAGGQLSRQEFQEAVGKAMRRGDESPDPFVTKVAQAWRAQVFDPLKEAAIKAGLLPKDVSVETAASYFSRMWNRNKLIAREDEFKQIVREWVDDMAPRWAEHGQPIDDAMELGHDIANHVFNVLTGKVEAGARPEFITITARGPLKERTFNIPDALVEDFLEHNVDLVGRRYTRIMGADVELANKFGSPDMKDAITAVRSDYARLRTGIEDEKQLMRLGQAEKADIRDLEGVRDLLRSTRNETPIERDYAKLVRSANHVNYIRQMGEVVLASLTDVVRPAMVHGLSAYMGGLAQLATNMKAIKLSVGEAQLAGNVAERVLAHRLATISEIIDPYSSRGPVEAFLERMTNTASNWNGIRIWTDGMKSIASVMTQNRILGGVADFSKVKASEKAYLAYLGIDQSMAERIAAQFATHGETLDGVRVAHTEDWTDAIARRTYRAAMNKDVDSIIVQKSVADVPLFASTPTGKMLLQFKSFALASHQKVLLRGLQESQARFVGGLVAMTALGMFMTWAKAISGNRTEKLSEIDKNPGWWIAEGLDRSGVLSVPIEIANAFEKITGFNPVKSPLKAFDEGNAQSQKNQNRNELGAALGPTFGLVQDAGTVAGIPKKLAEGEDLTKGQKNAAARLLPFNTYAGIRQMLNYVLNPPD